MALPDPRPGMVIHYGYLWARQAVAPGEIAEKERPCVIVAVSSDGTGTSVFAAPITHTKPYHPEDAVPLPAEVRRRLGLDGKESWLMCSEVNEFTWPGVDLCRIPHREPRSCIYGRLPAEFLEQAFELIDTCAEKPAFRQVPRDLRRTLAP